MIPEWYTMKFLRSSTYLTLTKEDQQTIKDMSDAICKQDRSYFVDNFKRDKTMDLNRVNLNGFGAELAFCRLCEIEFDSSTNQGENHFNKTDATLKNGMTIDVKSTVYLSGKLIIRKGKENKKVNSYVLMIGEFPTFKFAGWTRYKDIIQEELIVDMGTGDSYLLPQGSLYKTLKIT